MGVLQNDRISFPSLLQARAVHLLRFVTTFLDCRVNGIIIDRFTFLGMTHFPTIFLFLDDSEMLVPNFTSKFICAPYVTYHV